MQVFWKYVRFIKNRRFIYMTCLPLKKSSVLQAAAAPLLKSTSTYGKSRS
jgi:hypothetical protein